MKSTCRILIQTETGTADLGEIADALPQLLYMGAGALANTHRLREHDELCERVQRLFIDAGGALLLDKTCNDGNRETAILGMVALTWAGLLYAQSLLEIARYQCGVEIAMAGEVVPVTQRSPRSVN